MSNPWQQFSGEFIASCAVAIEQLCSNRPIDAVSVGDDIEQFLRSLAPLSLFTLADISLFQSASSLDRVFRLPNEHAKGLFFFGAQCHGVSATGADVTPLGALRSCLGEALERQAHCSENLAHTASIAQKTLSTAELPPGDWRSWLAHQQGRLDCHYAQCTRWALARSLDGGTSLHLPTDFIFRVAADQPDPLPSETSGWAAAPDRPTALCGALLELIERDTVAMWWYGGRQASSLQLHGAELFAFTRDTTLIRRNSRRPFWLNLLENEFGVYVVAALSADADGKQVVAGFGAHMNILNAAISAVKELSQMELGMQLVLIKLKQGGESALNPIDVRQLERANRLTVKSFPELLPDAAKSASSANSAPFNEGQMQDELVRRLTDAGYCPFIVDLKMADVPVPLVRAVIPELESMDFSRRSCRMAEQLRNTGSDENIVAAKPALT